MNGVCISLSNNPDLTIISVSTSSSSIPTGEGVSFSITARNNGPGIAPSGDYIRLEIIGPSGTRYSKDYPYLGGGTGNFNLNIALIQTNDNFELVYDNPESYTIRVTIDPR